MSAFEIASAYCKATDEVGEEFLDFFLGDAAPTGETAKMKSVAMATARPQWNRVRHLKLIMTHSLLDGR
jgi:hypothetical protein